MTPPNCVIPILAHNDWGGYIMFSCLTYLACTQQVRVCMTSHPIESFLIHIMIVWKHNSTLKIQAPFKELEMYSCPSVLRHKNWRNPAPVHAHGPLISKTTTFNIVLSKLQVLIFQIHLSLSQVTNCKHEYHLQCILEW